MISADLSIALSSGRSFQKESLGSTIWMGSDIHLSLGVINLDTTPLWIGKKLNLLENMVFLISPKSGKYIHIYFKPNSILSLSEESAFFIRPPWERGLRFTSYEPLLCCICSHIWVPPAGELLSQSLSAWQICSVQIWLSLIDFFFLCEMIFLYFGVLVLKTWHILDRNEEFWS